MHSVREDLNSSSLVCSCACHTVTAWAAPPRQSDACNTRFVEVLWIQRRIAKCSTQWILPTKVGEDDNITPPPSIVVPGVFIFHGTQAQDVLKDTCSMAARARRQRAAARAGLDDDNDAVGGAVGADGADRGALAATETAMAANRQQRGAAAAAAARGGTSRPSRLRSLLALLAVTTVLLVLLQTYRAAFGPVRTSGRRGPHRGWGELAQRLRAPAAPAVTTTTTDEGIGTSDTDDARDKAADSLDWRAYLASMRQHFDEEIARVKGGHGPVDSSGGGGGGGGMAVVPGQGVRDHSSAGAGEAARPQHVAGKSPDKADEDRRVALEDIDQETLKAMFDALHDAGVRV